ncbi:MAG: ABC transporter ATP-binding protein, partial [Gudongella sp.]|nr:ABC transporter ATP-binding protein [Gudongella sp.]
MDKSNHLLEIKNLRVTYKSDNGLVHAVENLNLKLNHEETLGFVGETGAGKTTTAYSIMGLLPSPQSKIESGEIFFEGEQLLDKSEKELRKIRGRDIAMIFQDPMTSLNPVMTVIEQIEEMLSLHKKASKKEIRESAYEILEKVGIKRDRAFDYPHQFSGGMKQRVVIAIALSCDPKLLIADEPTTALDVTIQAQVLDLMKRLKTEFGTSMIMITHDLGIVAEICDKVAIMYAGSVVEYADKKSLYTNPSHPYTKGLFNSIPDIENDNIEELKEIKGHPPDPTNLLVGCNF